MKHTTPLRQKFIDHLTLRQLAARTIQSDTGWIVERARFHRRSPDTLGHPEIASWLRHLINERKRSAASGNLARNARRAFHSSFLGRATESLLAGIQRPARHSQPPRVLGPDEVERLGTVGTVGDPLARAFLMTVYGCGRRLSEATHVRIADRAAARRQLRVSHHKGGRERVVPLRAGLRTLDC